MHRTQRRGTLAAIVVLAATSPLAAQQTMSNDKAMAGNRTMAMGTRGTFSGAMNHAASGSYAVIGSGKDRKLELGNDFNVDQSSDVYVVLAKGMAKDQGSLDLGKLRKAEGAQSFDIPESANLASFTSVLLWSKKDKAVIGEAPLGDHGSMGAMDHGAMDHGSMAKDTGMMKKP
jgi:hypothetical protein